MHDVRTVGSPFSSPFDCFCLQVTVSHSWSRRSTPFFQHTYLTGILVHVVGVGSSPVFHTFLVAHTYLNGIQIHLVGAARSSVMDTFLAAQSILASLPVT
jgi:hypothetical protein